MINWTALHNRHTGDIRVLVLAQNGYLPFFEMDHPDVLTFSGDPRWSRFDTVEYSRYCRDNGLKFTPQGFIGEYGTLDLSYDIITGITNPELTDRVIEISVKIAPDIAAYTQIAESKTDTGESE